MLKITFFPTNYRRAGITSCKLVTPVHKEFGHYVYMSCVYSACELYCSNITRHTENICSPVISYTAKYNTALIQAQGHNITSQTPTKPLLLTRANKNELGRESLLCQLSWIMEYFERKSEV